MLIVPVVRLPLALAISIKLAERKRTALPSKPSSIIVGAGENEAKEDKAPYGYVINETDTIFFEIKENGANINIQFGDEEPTGKITIVKQDAETGNIAQGDSKLEGAEYKVYAM